MSSRNRKQRPRRLRPINPNQRPQSHPRSRGGKLFVGIAVVLGAAVIVFAFARPKSPSAPAAKAPSTVTSAPAAAKPPLPSGPRFDAGSRIYDFGRAEGDKPVDCLFVFTNTGTALLEVTQVSPGCGCMKAGEWTRQVPPGQIGTIPVRLDAKNYTGPFAKSVIVTCNDASYPNPMLEIKGQVWRPLEITPLAAFITLSAEAPSNSASVRVISHLDEPLTLSDLQVSLPNLAVALQTNKPGKEYQINVHTMPPLPTSSQKGQITFQTSATNVPSTNISVGVNYNPVLQAFPYQLRLPPPPFTSTVSVLAWVRNHGTNPLVISEAAVNLPGVKVEAKDDPANRGHSLTLNFPAGFQVPPGTNAELVVKTTHPQFPELRVPILQPAGKQGK